MTYEKFLSLAKESGAHINPYLGFNLDKLWVYPPDKKSKKPVNAPDFIVQYWTIGGMSGGGYDGRKASKFVGEGKPDSFPDMIKVLAKITPQLSFIQYELLKTSGVFKEGEEIDYEYYGNYTEYGYRLVVLRELYDKLVEMGAIEST